MAIAKFYHPEDDGIDNDYILALAGHWRWENTEAESDKKTTEISYFFSNDGKGDPWEPWEMEAFEKVFTAIEAIANITFVEADKAESANLLEFKETDEWPPKDPDTGLRDNWAANHQMPRGDQAIGRYNTDNPDWTPDGLAPGGNVFPAILHEILHGLGLEHTFLDDHDHPTTQPWPDDAPEGSSLADSDYNTVMSYAGEMYGEQSAVGYGKALGPMAIDVAALQAMYGANETYRNGDDTYILPDQNMAGTGWISIWDTGGHDEIVYQGARDATIDLRPATLDPAVKGGERSFAEYVTGGFTIAKGVTIEDAHGGSSKDTIFGNDAKNHLYGNGGDDTIHGEGGDDWIFGGDRNDTLYGGTGGDRLYGGDGADSFFGGDGNDYFYIDAEDTAWSDSYYWLNGGAGRDTVYISSDPGAQLSLLATDVERVFGGSSGDEIDGSGVNVRLYFNGRAGDDVLTGGNARDTLRGGSDDDTLVASAGGDKLVGDAGVDTYDVSAATDQINVDLGEGYAFAGEFGLDTLITIENVIAGSGSDTLLGSDVMNVLDGGAGGDTLRGGAGADRLIGGTGNDDLWGDGISEEASSGKFYGSGNNLPGAPDLGDIFGDQAFGDTFVFDADSGSDTIHDWGKGDTLEISSLWSGGRTVSFDDVTISAENGDAHVSIHETHITLIGAAGQVTQDDFLFV